MARGFSLPAMRGDDRGMAVWPWAADLRRVPTADLRERRALCSTRPANRFGRGFMSRGEITNAKQGVNALTMRHRLGPAQLSDRVVVVAQVSPGDGTA